MFRYQRGERAVLQHVRQTGQAVVADVQYLEVPEPVDGFWYGFYPVPVQEAYLVVVRTVLLVHNTIQFRRNTCRFEELVGQIQSLLFATVAITTVRSVALHVIASSAVAGVRYLIGRGRECSQIAL